MTEDHLDKEISVSAEITPTSVKATAKVRFVNAVDRLLGNVVEWLNVRMEHGTSKRRAIMEGERKLIDAAAQYGVDRLGYDPQFAQAALEKQYGQVLGRQENKAEVVQHAIEDLRSEPPSEQQAQSGPEQLNPDFLNRFERYAEDASSDELRQRWGRVLAAEVRKPGTFSPKVLRVVDELDAGTAQLFERFCAKRLGNSIPIGLFGDLSFQDSAALTSAGLLIEPGFGQQLNTITMSDKAGVELYGWFRDNFGLTVRKDQVIENLAEKALLWSDSIPKLRVYVLTETGAAVASILPDNQMKALSELAEHLRQTPNWQAEVRKYWLPPGHDEWIHIPG